MGCFHVDYLLQAAEGQLDLSCRARSLESARADDDIDPRTRALLAEVPRIKAFASGQGLVPTGSYEEFVPLDRSAVVWVVTAAPPLSLDPERWSFPIVGSVPYLGWFDEQRARAEAAKLAARGLDVDVRGASAYSTLGWFADPVLSTMIEDGDDAAGELANTILHESVHATVYVKDQSEFNESLASFVADRLTPLWLEQRFGPHSDELATYLRGEAATAILRARLRQAYADLAVLYGSKRSRQDKLAAKERLLREVEAELGLARPLNNARLAGYDSYHGGAAPLEALLEACGGDLRRLMAAVKDAAPEDFGERQTSDIGPATERLARRCRR